MALNPNVYGDGTEGSASAGANTITHYYDKAGVKAANAVDIYQQFASKKAMPQKMGKTYKISKFLHMYDRTSDTVANSDFAKYGYLTSRTVSQIDSNLTAASMGEGEGVHNEVSIEKITMEGTFSRYGMMISYTDEVNLFSEDEIQTRYREELGGSVGVMGEDLVQKGMLATPTRTFTGVATSPELMGTGIFRNGADNTDETGGTVVPGGALTDKDMKVSYDLIRNATKKLVRNRAKKNTEIVVGSTKVGTAPIHAAYYAITHTDVISDLEMLVRGSGAETEFVFQPVHKYASAGTIVKGEEGAMHGVRFIVAESAHIDEGVIVRPWIGDNDGLAYFTQAAANAAGGNSASEQAVEYTGTLAYTGVQGSGADDAANANTARFASYPILFPTKDAFATIGLKGRDRIKFGSIDPSVVSATNPYGTQGFFSANFWYADVILEPEKLLRVDVLATA